MDSKSLYGKKRKREKNILPKKEESKINESTIITIEDCLCKNSFPYQYSFSLFKSINSIYYLIYPTFGNSLVIYDIIHNKKINEIKKAHEKSINYLRHQVDTKNRTDLLLSIDNNSMKIWNINNLACIHHFKDILNLYSACFIYNNDEIYIIFDFRYEKLKVYNLNGEMKNEMNIENNSIISIESFYDIELNQNYIIIGNDNTDNIISYKYIEDKVYHKYDNFDDSIHTLNIYKDNKKKKVILMYVTKYCTITFWDFHTGVFLQSIPIYIGNDIIYSVCLWNEKFLFVGNARKDIGNNVYSIRYVNLIKQEISDKKEYVLKNIPKTLRKINHEDDDYLIAHDYSGQITIWKNFNFN